MNSSRKYHISESQRQMMEYHDISVQLLGNRVRLLRKSIHEAVSQPKQEQIPTTSYERELMRINGISSSLLSKRIARGMTREEALNKPVRNYCRNGRCAI